MTQTLILPLLFSLGAPELLVILIVMSILSIPYFIPTIIARKKVNFTRILLLNIFLGWTFLGWALALIWAITDKTTGELPMANQMTERMPGAENRHRCPHCGTEFSD